MSRRCRIASDQLIRALLDRAAGCERTHCSDPLLRPGNTPLEVSTFPVRALIFR
jgi:hypothetical protein